MLLRVARCQPWCCESEFDSACDVGKLSPDARWLFRPWRGIERIDAALVALQHGVLRRETDAAETWHIDNGHAIRDALWLTFQRGVRHSGIDEQRHFRFYTNEARQPFRLALATIGLDEAGKQDVVVVHVEPSGRASNGAASTVSIDSVASAGKRVEFRAFPLSIQVGLTDSQIYPVVIGDIFALDKFILRTGNRLFLLKIDFTVGVLICESCVDMRNRFNVHPLLLEASFFESSMSASSSVQSLVWRVGHLRGQLFASAWSPLLQSGNAIAIVVFDELEVDFDRNEPIPFRIAVSADCRYLSIEAKGVLATTSLDEYFAENPWDCDWISLEVVRDKLRLLESGRALDSLLVSEPGHLIDFVKLNDKLRNGTIQVGMKWQLWFDRNIMKKKADHLPWSNLNGNRKSVTCLYPAKAGSLRRMKISCKGEVALMHDGGSLTLYDGRMKRIYFEVQNGLLVESMCGEKFLYESHGFLFHFLPQCLRREDAGTFLSLLLGHSLAFELCELNEWVSDISNGKLASLSLEAKLRAGLLVEAKSDLTSFMRRFDDFSSQVSLMKVTTRFIETSLHNFATHADFLSLLRLASQLCLDLISNLHYISHNEVDTSLLPDAIYQLELIQRAQYFCNHRGAREFTNQDSWMEESVPFLSYRWNSNSWVSSTSLSEEAVRLAFRKTRFVDRDSFRILSSLIPSGLSNLWEKKKDFEIVFDSLTKGVFSSAIAFLAANRSFETQAPWTLSFLDYGVVLDDEVFDYAHKIGRRLAYRLLCNDQVDCFTQGAKLLLNMGNDVPQFLKAISFGTVRRTTRWRLLGQLLHQGPFDFSEAEKSAFEFLSQLEKLCPSSSFSVSNRRLKTIAFFNKEYTECLSTTHWASESEGVNRRVFLSRLQQRLRSVSLPQGGRIEYEYGYSSLHRRLSPCSSEIPRNESNREIAGSIGASCKLQGDVDDYGKRIEEDIPGRFPIVQQSSINNRVSMSVERKDIISESQFGASTMLGERKWQLGSQQVSLSDKSKCQYLCVSLIDVLDWAPDTRERIFCELHFKMSARNVAVIACVAAERGNVLAFQELFLQDEDRTSLKPTSEQECILLALRQSPNNSFLFPSHFVRVVRLLFLRVGILIDCSFNRLEPDVSHNDSAAGISSEKAQTVMNLLAEAHCLFVKSRESSVIDAFHLKFANFCVINKLEKVLIMYLKCHQLCTTLDEVDLFANSCSLQSSPLAASAVYRRVGKDGFLKAVIFSCRECGYPEEVSQLLLSKDRKHHLIALGLLCFASSESFTLSLDILLGVLQNDTTFTELVEALCSDDGGHLTSLPYDSRMENGLWGFKRQLVDGRLAFLTIYEQLVHPFDVPLQLDTYVKLQCHINSICGETSEKSSDLTIPRYDSITNIIQHYLSQGCGTVAFVKMMKVNPTLDNSRVLEITRAVATHHIGDHVCLVACCWLLHLLGLEYAELCIDCAAIETILQHHPRRASEETFRNEVVSLFNQFYRGAAGTAGSESSALAALLLLGESVWANKSQRGLGSIDPSHFRLESAFCGVHGLPTSVAYLHELVRELDYVSFLYEAQIQNVSPESCLAIVRDSVQSKNVRDHLLVMVTKVMARENPRNQTNHEQILNHAFVHRNQSRSLRGSLFHEYSVTSMMSEFLENDSLSALLELATKLRHPFLSTMVSGFREAPISKSWLLWLIFTEGDKAETTTAKIDSVDVNAALEIQLLTLLEKSNYERLLASSHLFSRTDTFVEFVFFHEYFTQGQYLSAKLHFEKYSVKILEGNCRHRTETVVLDRVVSSAVLHLYQKLSVDAKESTILSRVALIEFLYILSSHPVKGLGCETLYQVVRLLELRSSLPVTSSVLDSSPTELVKTLISRNQFECCRELVRITTRDNKDNLTSRCCMMSPKEGGATLDLILFHEALQLVFALEQNTTDLNRWAKCSQLFERHGCDALATACFFTMCGSALLNLPVPLKDLLRLCEELVMWLQIACQCESSKLVLSKQENYVLKFMDSKEEWGKTVEQEQKLPELLVEPLVLQQALQILAPKLSSGAVCVMDFPMSIKLFPAPIQSLLWEWRNQVNIESISLAWTSLQGMGRASIDSKGLLEHISEIVVDEMINTGRLGEAEVVCETLSQYGVDNTSALVGRFVIGLVTTPSSRRAAYIQSLGRKVRGLVPSKENLLHKKTAKLLNLIATSRPSINTFISQVAATWRISQFFHEQYAKVCTERDGYDTICKLYQRSPLFSSLGNLYFRESLVGRDNELAKIAEPKDFTEFLSQLLQKNERSTQMAKRSERQIASRLLKELLVTFPDLDRFRLARMLCELIRDTGANNHFKLPHIKKVYHLLDADQIHELQVLVGGDDSCRMLAHEAQEMSKEDGVSDQLKLELLILAYHCFVFCLDSVAAEGTILEVLSVLAKSRGKSSQIPLLTRAMLGTRCYESFWPILSEILITESFSSLTSMVNEISNFQQKVELKLSMELFLESQKEATTSEMLIKTFSDLGMSSAIGWKLYEIGQRLYSREVAAMELGCEKNIEMIVSSLILAKQSFLEAAKRFDENDSVFSVSPIPAHEESWCRRALLKARLIGLQLDCLSRGAFILNFSIPQGLESAKEILTSNEFKIATELHQQLLAL